MPALSSAQRHFNRLVTATSISTLLSVPAAFAQSQTSQEVQSLLDDYTPVNLEDLVNPPVWMLYSILRLLLAKGVAIDDTQQRFVSVVVAIPCRCFDCPGNRIDVKIHVLALPGK